MEQRWGKREGGSEGQRDGEEGRREGWKKGQEEGGLHSLWPAHIVCVNLFLHNLQVSSSGSAHLCSVLTTLQPVKLLFSNLQHMADFSIRCLKAQQSLC